MTLQIKRRYNTDEWELIAEYEDGEFTGDDDFVRSFGWLEGKDEEEIMEKLDGPDLVAFQPEDTEKAKWMSKSDVSYEEIDDTFFEAYEKMVCWKVDEDDPDLSKAPNMFAGSDEVPEFVKDYVKEAFDENAFWSGRFEDMPSDAADRLSAVFKEKLTQPQGWSLTSLVDGITSEFGVSEDKAMNIARTETAALTNKAREEAYESRGEEAEEYKFYWTGVDDHRTTEICEAIKGETHPDHGGEPVTMGKLRDIVKKYARKYKDEGGTPGRATEWSPHYQCRHTFTRKVYL